MSADKRYYWLKLDENFFEDDTMAWIEEQENGKDYLIFYLKLCLKSLKDDGKLIRFVGQTLMPYDIPALAKYTNTKIDTVAVAMKLFEKIGLIEYLDTGEIFLSQIGELIGSETEVAKRVRKSRALANKKELEHKMLQCNTDVTKCNESKSKSKNLELDTEIELDPEIEKNIGHEKPVTDAGEQQFEKFWEAYPKKIAKKAVLQKWKNLKVNDALFESIMKGLEAWKQSQQWMKDGGQYIPNPTTFLNQERWNDEVASFGDPRNRIPTDEEYKQVTAEEFYGI